MMIRTPSSASEVSVDLTPIIDMVFLLLIFFLVATTFQQTEREMKVALPAAASAGPITASLREIVVNVDAMGRIIVAGRALSHEDLRALIGDAVQANPQQKVTIRGDRTVAYAAIVSVLDACKSSGIQEPFLDTVLER